MTALLLDEHGRTGARMEREPLHDGFGEGWLQKLLFENPSLVPIEELDHGAGTLVPLCRELPIAKAGGTVFLDLLAVTSSGRLVLVECKLWRNPQARREVVAQILEYAALLRRWTYADLTARLKARFDWQGENPIFDRVKSLRPGLDEAHFSDTVARCLRRGDFQLIIAGDGIREDMAAIGQHLDQQGAGLALIEFQIWRDHASERRVIVPHIPFRTEVLRQRVITDAAGVPLQTHDEAEETADQAGPGEPGSDPERMKITAANRAFWQGVITAARFDHPDQPAPRHGGNNWIRVPMPSPAKWLTAYRWKDRVGFSLVEEDGSGACARLAAAAEEIRAETGLSDLRFHAKNETERLDRIGLDRALGDFASDAAVRDWIVDTANRLVTALRPRLVALADL